MDKFELKPSFFNSSTVFFLLTAAVTSLVLGFTVFPKAYDLYLSYPSDPAVLQVFFGITLAVAIVWLMFIGSVISSKQRKIEVNHDLVYFMKKTKWGLGEWVTDKVIDFSKITEISERKKAVYTGKVVITYFWLVFHSKDRGTFEMLLNGWNMQNMKNLFFYLRGKYPSIKFNNIVLKDSAEKLSGLSELMNN